MVEKASKGRKEEVVRREYTINLHKRLHGSNNLSLFFSVTSRCVCYVGQIIEEFDEERSTPRSRRRLAPKAIKQIKKFEQKAMRTTDVRVDVKLNKHTWSTYGVAGSVACHGESE
ncbi:hypothetical protein C4D60_Mb10t25300 [Musa balbisiana]|uniref:Uncharacterized protein n=1 Tax=Musa balbisiana TaxID=52838 RepID=A0A4S8J0K9_MUSBA|nr:hypothetical protein C4D60_Mb10t25300 [Musa balbisiana]